MIGIANWRCWFGAHKWVRPLTLFRYCSGCGKKQHGTVFGWRDAPSGDPSA